MNVTIMNSLDSEISLILYDLISISNGIYKKNNLYPLFKNIPQTLNTIVIPKIDNKEFSNIIQNVDIDWITTPDENLSNEVMKSRKRIKNILLNQKEVNYFKFIRNISLEWGKIKEKFINYFTDVLNCKHQNINITVFISQYGSPVAFGYDYDKSNEANVYLYVYLRNDSDINLLLQGIICAYMWKNYYNKKLTMLEQNYSPIDKLVLSDSIIKNTKLSELFTNSVNYLNIFKSLPTNNEVISLSRLCLEKLGFEFTPDIYIKDQILYLDGDITNIKLSVLESEVFSFLILNKNRICTYDELGNIMWSDPNNFNMWSISRIIYKLRKKLKNILIANTRILTYRKQGFMLKS